MRLNADFLTQVPSFINPLKESELDLRYVSVRYLVFVQRYQIPLIENLGILRDTNDSIDFTDNDIRYLGNFPRMRRLETLLCGRNRISTIDPELGKVLPNLKILSLTQNHIQQLADLDPLSTCTRLTHLSCLDNAVSQNQYYRLYLVWRIPSLHILDFERVRENERSRSQEMFGTIDRPTEIAASIMGVKSRVFDLGTLVQSTNTDTNATVSTGYALTPEEKEQIKEAIKNASSIAEINRLEAMLLEGKIPK
ncbi:U2 snRNP-associated protein Lea1 [Schizosaccharomyces osmophilus]|uniref:U2 small nuclear ribonucleoprotein A' n=1 Tax=Schizosaccharomyces osmophilus TaxID=2545709 RepID=A0AAF0AUM4_9SCHI|nr:U2 snRNP-associated protein Lea1 [Schizosaccharomyces osmophilus]WBW71747.1 U2 snRNP-associated protein Lea1 [Schizosaccharomyces osmophilus]